MLCVLDSFCVQYSFCYIYGSTHGKHGEQELLWVFYRVIVVSQMQNYYYASQSMS